MLPGEPAPQAQIDQHWQAIGRIAEFIDTSPDRVWDFVHKWGVTDCADLRMAVATILLEHLVGFDFEKFFPKVESAVEADPRFADTFSHCWRFGQSERDDNASLFEDLKRRAGRVR